MSSKALESRRLVEVNTDPQRRCYDGCHFSSEIKFTEWAKIDSGLTTEQAERRLAFWSGLNAYAVSQRGKVGTQQEYRIVEETQ